MPAKNFKPILKLKSNNHNKVMKQESNQAPDEATLTLWMDGELEGDALARVEAWAKDHPELLAQRDAVRAMSESIKSHVPVSVEPPYPDFFNQRIMRHIEEESAAGGASSKGDGGLSWRGLVGRWAAIPVAAGAMLLCFYLGLQLGDRPVLPARTVAVSPQPLIYTPDGDVSAEIFNSEDGQATVIVLDGLEDIPDDFDIVGVSTPAQDVELVTAQLVF